MKQLILICGLVLGSFPSSAETINFEHGLSVPGVVFNDFYVDTQEPPYWPAHSGTHLAFAGCCDYPPTITFGQPINSFSGYFTYSSVIISFGMSITAYGVNDQQIETIYSPYLTNNDPDPYGSSVYDPNEFLGISSATPIAWLLFGYDEEFGEFSVDDISFSATPEPSSLTLVVVAAFACRLRWSKAGSKKSIQAKG